MDDKRKRAKPIRFGYKLWAMCADSGYCFNFFLYCGKEVTQSKNPLGTRVVTSMLTVVDNPFGYTVHFDDFFSNYNLFKILKEKGFRATGTIRDNRTEKCPLKSVKEVEKTKRVTHDHRFDKKNKIMLSQYVLSKGGIKTRKSQAPISQPKLINNYNKFMGGVDHHDWLLEKHSIAIKGKKWYWCLITRIVDMAVINSFILYNLLHPKDNVSIKEFRSNIAVAYLKLGHGRRVQKGRPLSIPSTSRAQVVYDVCFDEKNHILDKRDNKRRCQFPLCKGKPRTFCKKCNATLCLPCFPKYHDKSYAK
ncbi:hypothetical protein NQ314_020007 [Rhamnusium bicolor]|uniref:PiggyBac transposable element-derived protein domain-containing protein n=1 Tax=Rhamnusium bicolor TaxID=1586634 RepID=A0AAV8WML3_9CUCU|nr:hypothetical protein NQ314_020007 [Rhamnusium bicolor]